MNKVSRIYLLALLLFAGSLLPLLSVVFDAAPFGLPLKEDIGIMWEDPREIHTVVVHFADTDTPPSNLKLEYWGSRWPGQRLPKDREPGGGDVGWMELGNWYKYGWRVADTVMTRQGKIVTFKFNPVNLKEFPDIKDYPADFRYTLKVRITSEEKIPKIEKISAYTDSTLQPRALNIVFNEKPDSTPHFEAFNGYVRKIEKLQDTTYRLQTEIVVNSDPNTFDRTLITVIAGNKTVTFKPDDLAHSPIVIPHAGIAVTIDDDKRDYMAILKDVKSKGVKTLYDRVSEMPEQTWRAAWEGMPPKKSHIYFPIGLDGGRHRFRLHANGGIDFRSNDHYLRSRPGKDTPRLSLEKAPVNISFSLPSKPIYRTIVEESLPICITKWQMDGVEITQTALETKLDGFPQGAYQPSGDDFGVLMLKFVISNTTQAKIEYVLPIGYKAGSEAPKLTFKDGYLLRDNHFRFQIAGQTTIEDGNPVKVKFGLQPDQKATLILKIPYVVLTEESEIKALSKLNFDEEFKNVAGYWRRRLNESANLITPEPMLNEFYRAHAGHLLINCELEPNSERRFARVGSFSYGVYGNESCMMVVDLERRGYHKEAQQCLDAWAYYQGTVGLPGDFSTKEGVLYGAGGYEAGGYNQHHGWILWMFAEHYKFTRDEKWLKKVAPVIIKGADWIIRETARTADRHALDRGLLPAGSLEDIGDWWTWLSTSCYTWRGLDNAAWALEQISHPDAKRIRKAADEYHSALLSNFKKASELSPVVRLRDGTFVPKFPSHTHRRGRSFGWICETLEGALHLLITRAIDPNSMDAEWILKDYEDNLYLSNQYGYMLEDFEKYWFSRGGMSMQACLLLGVEPYLYRDDVKHALRALFNAQAVSYFPDVRLNTEHALPRMGDWRGDHYKSSDEANCAGWLRYIFVREENENLLLIGQAVPRNWLEPGKYCGIEKTATWFGTVSVLYSGFNERIMCQLKAPNRNPPQQIRIRFRDPQFRPIKNVTVNGEQWKNFNSEWVILPGNIGNAQIIATF